MKSSRFTMAFQLISLVLVFSLVQVYVIAAPTKANTDPKPTDKSSVTQPIAETVVADSATTAPNAASEKMPLTAGTKTMLKRIFSKSNVEARIASSGTFLDVKSTAKDSFKMPRKALATPQSDDDDDDDDGTKRGVWIAVGVLAAVLVVVIIGLRHDRGIENAGPTQ